MKRTKKTILNRIVSLTLGFVMVLSSLSTGTMHVYAEETADKTGTMEYVISYNALSGSKLPVATDAALSQNDCYTYKGQYIQNKAMLSSTYQANLNAAGEQVEPWTIMDSSLTDAWDLLGLQLNNWMLFNDSRNLQLSTKTANYSDETLGAYIAFKVNINKAGTYDFYTAVNVDESKKDYMASPAVYIAPFGTYNSDLNSIRTADVDSNGAADYYLGHLDISGYDTACAGTYQELNSYTISEEQLGDYIVLFAFDSTSLANSSNAKSGKQYIWLSGFKFVGDTEGDGGVNGDDEENEEIVIATQKTGRTFYTDEMIANLQENYEKYDWAKEEVNAAISMADLCVANLDLLYSYATSDGIPRTWRTCLKSAPSSERGKCAYCGQTSKADHTFIVDPINQPWKVQCPHCQNWFPSNDFKGLYDNVMAANNGVYDVEFAKQWNAQNVANGGKDYLKNEMYPDMPEDWGVDAGMGYITGNKHANGVSEQYNFIPYFTLCGIWAGTGAGEYKGILLKAVSNLSLAYLCTGNEEYGRAGAILIDRIADVYPSFTQESFHKYFKAGYHTSNGSSGYGKISGCIRECSLVPVFAEGYDAFWPMYEDAEVISYLSAKAEEYNLANDKSSAALIRQNIEDGLLREIIKGLYDRSIYGNFGYPQYTAASVAVVLDSHPETDELLDWLYKPQNIIKGTEANGADTYVTGGGLITNMVNNVSRDGQGSESAFSYNDLWVTDLLDVALVMGRYDEYEGFSLLEHPKYLQMIVSVMESILVYRGTPDIGDGGVAYGQYAQPLNKNIDTFCIPAFTNLVDKYPEQAQILAQYICLKAGDTISELKADIYTKNPEDIGAQIVALANQEGGYDFDKSSNMTGYGLSVLRSGTMLDKPNNVGLIDTQRDFWMYYGGATSHKHLDALNIGLEAFGIGMSNDLGKPEAKSTDPNRVQWISTTIAHNTVVVDEKSQNSIKNTADSLHYDGKGERVQLIDVSAEEAYDVTDEYRRTLVMVDYNESYSYAIDFFRVVGGNDHLYSFHASSESNPAHSEEINFVVQQGGTYASPDVEYGEDPGTLSGTLVYPSGYTWLYDVHKAEATGLNEFFVDYAINDFRKTDRNTGLVHRLRLTMLNDWEADEISLANGKPARKDENAAIDHLEYMLVRRKGENLDTLFTTVYEPYANIRFVKGLSQVEVTEKAASLSAEASDDVVKAVKVETINGHTDYIVYATNNEKVYTVTDGERSFDFAGFVGVVTYDEAGEIVYTYVHDGTIIADVNVENGSIEGEILDFERDFTYDNWVDVHFSREITDEELADLPDRLVNFARERAGNSDMVIKSAERISNSNTDVRLHFGLISLIDNFVDDTDDTKGYVYDVEVGKAARISFSSEVNEIPEIPVLPETDDDTDEETGKESSGQTSSETGKESGGQTSGETGKESGGQTSGETGKESGEQTSGETGKESGEQTSGETGKESGEQTGGETGKESGEQTGGETGKESDGKTNDDSKKPVVEEPSSSVEQEPATSASSTKTDNDSNFGIYVALVMTALACIAGFVLVYRKKRRE